MKNKLAEISINYKSNIKPENKIKITSPEESAHQLRNIWNDKIDYQESMYLMLLDRANNILGYTLLATGATTGVLVDIKMILQTALKSNAHGVIISHNHPSGNTTPSSHDNKLTTKVKNGLEAIDIKLLDHLIITSDSYYSYADQNNNAL